MAGLVHALRLAKDVVTGSAGPLVNVEIGINGSILVDMLLRWFNKTILRLECLEHLKKLISCISVERRQDVRDDRL